MILDIVLVWATPQVETTTATLHGTAPPVPFHAHVLHTHPLPRLQDVTFGSALMGWLDLLAPALLGRDRAVPRPGRARDDGWPPSRGACCC